MADNAGICNAILWFLILWFLAWPFAWFLAFWYVTFLPFTVCIPQFKDICESMFKLMQVVVVCAENMKNKTPVCGGGGSGATSS